jgi:hypothetical protein
MEDLSIAALIIAAAWFVIDSLRVSELATGLCQRICDEQALQLLDQTIHLKRMGLHWGAEGIRLRRTYQFDCSRDGEERVTGCLVLVGSRLEATILPPKGATDYP